MAIRCTTKIVHIIWTTISNFDVCWPITAVTTPVKTHRPGDLTVCCCWVSTIHPTGCVSVTPVGRWTWSWHSCAGWTLETEPSRADPVITISVGISISSLPVSIVQTPVILTFWHKRIWVEMIKTSRSWKALDNVAVTMLTSYTYYLNRTFFHFQSPPFNQPVALVPHLNIGGHEVAILMPAEPSKRNQPGPIVLSQ